MLQTQTRVALKFITHRFLCRGLKWNRTGRRGRKVGVHETECAVSVYLKQDGDDGQDGAML